MSNRNFKELHEKVVADPTRAARVERERQAAITEHIDYALAEMRAAAGMTQVELAAMLQMPQGNVSRMENSDDPRLSTLRRYVEGLGGHLEVCAVFGDIHPARMSLRLDRTDA